jgi:PKD repeat protein
MMRSTKMLLQLAAGLGLAMAWLLSAGASGVRAQALTCASVLPTPTNIAGLSDGTTSADGCYTVYETRVFTLLPGETYHYQNIFVYSRASGATVRVSLNPDGTPLTTGTSLYELAISPNGRYLLFADWYNEVYLHDRDADGNGTFDEAGMGKTANILLPTASGETEFQSVFDCLPGTSGNFSADGNTVVYGRCYGTSASAFSGIFVYTIGSGAVNKITDGNYPRMSGNGRYVIYSKWTTILGTSDERNEIFRWDRDLNENDILDDSTPTPELASVNDQGDPANWGVNPAYRGEISYDGRYVAFDTDSTNLVPGDENYSVDVFVHDFVDNSTKRVSLTNEGYALNDYAIFKGLSEDGRFVSFTAKSDAVVAWDDNHAADLFLRDRTMGTTTLITGKADRNLTVYAQEQPALSLTIYGPAEGGLNRDYSFSATLGNQSGALATSFTWQVTDVSTDIVHSGVSAATDQVKLQWSTTGAKTIHVTAATPGGPVSADLTFTVFSPPSANFTADKTDGADRLDVTFTNQSSGEYRTIYWDLGNPSATGDSSETTSEDYYPGVYSVSLTVTGPGGVSTLTKTDYIHVTGSNPYTDTRPFLPVGSLGLPDANGASSAWGDFDQDGILELVISGCDLPDLYGPGRCTQPFTRVYKNQGGVFVDMHAGLMGQGGYASSVDLDQDGLMDIAVSGSTEDSETTALTTYHNLGNGHFARYTSKLPRSYDPAPLTWVDYNQDGFSDVVIDGALYRNLGGTFQDTSIRFANLGTAADWGDYDGDGDPDLLTTGSGYKTRLYRNDGDTFTEVTTNLPNVNYGAVSWVDYDHNGSLDVMISGTYASGGSTSGLFSVSGGVFTNLGVSLPNISSQRVTWADYDHDGDLDLLSDHWLYRNDGSSFFASRLHYSSGSSSSNWIDYDQDGKLDLEYSTGPDWSSTPYRVFNFFHLNSIPANPSPSVPGNPSGSYSGGQATLSWNAATDDLTSSTALTYQLRLSTTPGGASIPYPNPQPLPGNLGERTQVILKNLPSGKTYYWSVQAVDEGLTASAFTAEQSLIIPETPISDITISGETLAFPATAYTYTTTLTPENATLPVTYTWQADGQTKVTHSGSNLPNDTATFTWANSGTYTITVSADNGLSQPVSKQLTVQVSTIPRPDFSVCYMNGEDSVINNSVCFQDRSTGTVTGWLWDFGDGQTSTSRNPYHPYASPGDYTVSLTASGPEGSATATKTNYIHIHNPVHASFTVSPDTSGTAPLPLTFTSTSTGDIKSIQWSISGENISTESLMTHTFTTSGSYGIYLTVNGMGNDSDTSYRTITIHSNSHAAFHVDKSVGAAPMTVHFTNDSTGDFTSSAWRFGYAGTSTETNPSFTFTSLYSNRVTLTITGPTGSDSVSQDIQVYPPVSAAINVNPGTSGAAPFTVYFTSPASWDAVSLLWDFGDGTTSTNIWPTHIFQTVGDYTVTLTAVGRGGDTDVRSVLIHVTEKGASSIHAALTATTTSGISPLQVTFTSQTTGDFTTLAWDPGDQTYGSTGPTFTHTYTTRGTYTARLTASNGSKSDSATITINVYAPAYAEFHTDVTSGDAPLTVHFTNDSTGDYTSISWIFSDGSESTDEPSPVHTYTRPGNYNVVLILDGPGGKSIAVHSVQVSGHYYSYLPTVTH